MNSRSSSGRWRQRWCTQPLEPLMEGPDPDMQEDGNKKESSWEVIREWFRLQKSFGTGSNITNNASYYGSNNGGGTGMNAKTGDLRLLLGVLGCPLAPIPLVTEPLHPLHSKDIPIMLPGMWSLELVVGGHKVIAGSDGKIVWRHTPWLGTHAAKGRQRPLRRIMQGLDPKSTASLFGKAQCLGEKRIADEDCFVLKVAADREAVMERSEGPAEVMRHVLYGYFSQKSGLLVYLEDSHLTRVCSPHTDEAVYWETTIGSTVGDYREVDGVCIAHGGRSIATVFRFGEEETAQYSRSRMEEVWRIDDVDFNVPGLSLDYFIPPADIFDPNLVLLGLATLLSPMREHVRSRFLTGPK
ncbi:hypothetical protein CRG98_014059 [Punica granatum]|uniref:Uncharacterized protein n=1 Tax=Punica granatum TaxID=22663 RepID=A0A2I0KAJ2_PUNGR|nr:hypothetical protein CRG98_014059 [Punica granatum]